MKKILFLVIIILSTTLICPISHTFAQKEKYQFVIEESYYKVNPENEDEFLEIHKKKIFPFWKEVEKMDLIDGEIKMYTQRIHTLKPSWTYKTVVRFKNYNAIDKWLEKREEIINKLFPEEGGYNAIRKKVMAITEEHWDELIKEIPLE